MHSGEPSETARRVAAQRLTFPRPSTDYGDPGADERLARDVADSVDISGSPLRAYLEARTRFFDRVVVESIAAGIGQIVVGAAGYDGRALRYAKLGVRWFEVDHPSTQRDKLRRLASLAIAMDHVRFVAADFATDSLPPPLIAAGFDPIQSALFLMEGVAVYLERSTLEAVLQQFRTVAGSGSLLAISLSVSGPSADIEARRNRFQAAVARLGEPARTIVEADQVGPLLSATGWRARELRATNDSSRSRRVAAGFVLAEPA